MANDSARGPAYQKTMAILSSLRGEGPMSPETAAAMLSVVTDAGELAPRIQVVAPVVMAAPTPRPLSIRGHSGTEADRPAEEHRRQERSARDEDRRQRYVSARREVFQHHLDAMAWARDRRRYVEAEALPAVRRNAEELGAWVARARALKPPEVETDTEAWEGYREACDVAFCAPEWLGELEETERWLTGLLATMDGGESKAPQAPALDAPTTRAGTEAWLRDWPGLCAFVPRLIRGEALIPLDDGYHWTMTERDFCWLANKSGMNDWNGAARYLLFCREPKRTTPGTLASAADQVRKRRPRGWARLVDLLPELATPKA